MNRHLQLNATYERTSAMYSYDKHITCYIQNKAFIPGSRYLVHLNEGVLFCGSNFFRLLEDVNVSKPFYSCLTTICLCKLNYRETLYRLSTELVKMIFPSFHTPHLGFCKVVFGAGYWDWSNELLQQRYFSKSSMIAFRSW